jgi:3-hydroxymyristoyl/3-hydroxydecanoyl-(acyl carrier protein) dehydratase
MRFYLFDRITGFIPNQEARGIKNVSQQEEFLLDHYERLPFMPEPLIIESLAQLGGWAITVSSNYTYLAVMVMIKNVVFNGSAVPGDQLQLQVIIQGMSDMGAQISGKAEIDGTPVVEIETLTYVLYPIPEQQQAQIKNKYIRLSGGYLS